MVNAIPGRNLPVLNFAHHLTKPWTDQFVHVNGKQEFSTNRRDGRPLLMVCYLSIWGLSLTHTDDHILVTHSHGRSHSTFLIWVSTVNQKGLLRARQKIYLCAWDKKMILHPIYICRVQHHTEYGLWTWPVYVLLHHEVKLLYENMKKFMNTIANKIITVKDATSIATRKPENKRALCDAAVQRFPTVKAR